MSIETALNESLTALALLPGASRYRRRGDGGGSMSSRQEVVLSPSAPLWAHLVSAVLKHVTTVRRADEDAPCYGIMPYCLHAMRDRPDRVVVNRRYKPLGFLGSEWALYQDAIGQHMRADEFVALREAGIVNERGYLHHDGTTPREH